METHYRSRHTERPILRELTHRVSNELAAVTALVAAARTSPGGARGWIRVEFFEHATHIECRIEDSGCCTTPQVSRGVGLSMVHELTKEMGGALQQTFGLKGSVSTIMLPGSQ